MEISILQNIIVVRQSPGTSIKEIDNFLNRHENASRIPSGVHQRGQKYVEPNARNSTSVIIDKNDPIVLAVAQTVRHVNENYFKCNVTEYCRENEMLQYDVKGKFTPHTDIIYPQETIGINRHPVRKITSVLMLSHHESFTGGILRLWKGMQGFRFDWCQGDIVILPSFVRHGVEPVQSGIRRTLVSWSYGAY